MHRAISRSRSAKCRTGYPLTRSGLCKIVFRTSIVMMCHAATRVVYYDRASSGRPRSEFLRRRALCRAEDRRVNRGRRPWAGSNDEGDASGRDWSRIHREKFIQARESAARCRRGRYDRGRRRFGRFGRFGQPGASSSGRSDGMGEFVTAGEGKQCGNGVGSSRIRG